MEVYSGALTCDDGDARSQRDQFSFGAAQALRGICLSRARQGHMRSWAQRRRQDQPARCAGGQHAITSGSIVWEGMDITALKPADRARARHRLRAAGPGNFPVVTVKGNLETGFAPLKRDQRSDPGRCVFAFPGAKRHAAAARRRPFRRSAAATCDRPCAGDAAAPAAARRADRRHPAIDHQGYRPRDQLLAELGKSPSCWSSSISISRSELADDLW